MNNTLNYRNITCEAKYELYGLLDLLTLYVNVQEALVDKIIIDINNTEYILMNSHHSEIERMNIDDNNLLDVLISLAPKRIVINKITQFVDKDLLKIIVAVFKERVEMYMN